MKIDCSRGSSSLPNSLLYKLLTKLSKASYLEFPKIFLQMMFLVPLVHVPVLKLILLRGLPEKEEYFRQLALQFYHAPQMDRYQCLPFSYSFNKNDKL